MLFTVILGGVDEILIPVWIGFIVQEMFDCNFDVASKLVLTLLIPIFFISVFHGYKAKVFSKMSASICRDL
jgi:hypothetical protein